MRYMRNREFFAAGILLLLSGFCIYGCGKSTNLFGWTHAEGKSDDPEVLLHDADAALASGDYQAAMDYYKKIVDNDSTNSLARYGYVTAYMKKEFQDLDVATLLTNLSNQSSDTANSSLIDPSKFSTQTLIDMGNALVDNLAPISEGKCDGDVKSSDIGMNVNLAFGYMLQAVGTIMDPGKDGKADYDFKKDANGDYKLYYSNTQTEVTDPTAALGSTVKADVLAKLNDAETTVQDTVAANPTKTNADKTLNDIAKMIDDLKAEISKT